MNYKRVVVVASAIALAGIATTGCGSNHKTTGTFPYCSTSRSITGVVSVSRYSDFPCVVDHHNDFQAPMKTRRTRTTVVKNDKPKTRRTTTVIRPSKPKGTTFSSRKK